MRGKWLKEKELREIVGYYHLARTSLGGVPSRFERLQEAMRMYYQENPHPPYTRKQIYLDLEAATKCLVG